MNESRLKVGGFIVVEGKKRTIVGETRVSWIVQLDRWVNVKFPKRREAKDRWVSSEIHRGFGGVRGFASTEEYDEFVWVHEKRHDIAHRVQCCENAAALRQIAAILGMEVEA